MQAGSLYCMQIRESIKALFPNRTCFPLVRPMSDESQLQRLEAVPPSQLRPEFKQVSVAVQNAQHLTLHLCLNVSLRGACTDSAKTGD